MLGGMARQRSCDATFLLVKRRVNLLAEACVTGRVWGVRSGQSKETIRVAPYERNRMFRPGVLEVRGAKWFLCPPRACPVSSPGAESAVLRGGIANLTAVPYSGLSNEHYR